MLAVNRSSFVGGYNAVSSIEAAPARTLMPKQAEVGYVNKAQETLNKTDIVAPINTEKEKEKPTLDLKIVDTATNKAENIVIPDSQGGVVLIRPDKQVFRKKILDFTEEYSRVLAVAFGASAFLFNLGSTTVLNRRSMIWSGVAVVVAVVAFLIWHDRNKLFNSVKYDNVK